MGDFANQPDARNRYPAITDQPGRFLAFWSSAKSMNEPKWRIVLCWGAVFTFFTVPIVGLTLLILSDTMPSIRNHMSEYKFIGPFFQSVTALVFGLSGLRSLDKYVETKNGNGKFKNPEK